MAGCSASKRFAGDVRANDNGVRGIRGSNFNGFGEIKNTSRCDYGGKFNGSWFNKPKFCSECSKPGHTPQNCSENQVNKKKVFNRALMVKTSSVDADDRLFDSGALQHMTNNLNNITNKVPYNHSIKTANNSSMQVISKCIGEWKAWRTYNQRCTWCSWFEHEFTFH